MFFFIIFLMSHKNRMPHKIPRNMFPWPFLCKRPIRLRIFAIIIIIFCHHHRHHYFFHHHPHCIINHTTTNCISLKKYNYNSPSGSAAEKIDHPLIDPQISRFSLVIVIFPIIIISQSLFPIWSLLSFIHYWAVPWC